MDLKKKTEREKKGEKVKDRECWYIYCQTLVTVKELTYIRVNLGSSEEWNKLCKCKT
jgi:hypothetical protein